MPPTLYDRQKLLDDVWTTPVSHLTTKYLLSDAGLKKLCSRLQIPTPPRGYWAKLKAGKRVPSKPSLAEYTGAPYYLYQPQRLTSGTPTPDLTVEVKDPRLAAVISYENEAAHCIAVAARLDNPHPLVKLTQQALKKAPLDQRGQPAVIGDCIHLRVSKGMQQRALLIADALFKALDERVFQLRQDEKGVALLFHGLAYRLEFFESCKRVPYQPSEAEQRRRNAGHYVYTPPWSFLPSGVLTLQTVNGYGPKVTDGKGRQVESLLNTFLIRVATHGVSDLLAAEERARKEAEFAVRHGAWKKAKEKQEAELANLDALEKQAARWKRAQNLRAYMYAMRDSRCPDTRGEERQALIEWGLAKADWLDPLVDGYDEVLDEALEEPRRGYW